MRGVDETLPPYDELPVLEGAPPGSSWGLWGEHDLFGSLNLLTPERVLTGVRSVRKGAVFPLNLELELPDPPVFARVPFEHTVLGEGHGHDDELRMNTQSSSQWDGFRHIGHRDHGFYGGVADEDHGMHHWAGRGIAGRGVLADVARWRDKVGRPLKPDASDPIEPEDLQSTLADQGVESRPGDILLIRSGWLTWYRTLSTDERGAVAAGLQAPGLRPGRATAALLWDMHVAAVGADNPALEVWPPGAVASEEQRQQARDDPAARMEIFVHTSLLPMLGIPIGELFDLDALAEDCAADGRYEFLLTSAPLNVHQGVASPPNALAIK